MHILKTIFLRWFKNWNKEAVHSQSSVVPKKNNFIFALNIQKDEYMILKKLKFIRFLLNSADIVILPIIFNNKGMEISLRFIKYKTRGFLKKI